MRNVLLTVLLGAFGALASAQFTIDDSGFDYFGADDGYTAIGFEGGVFTLSFSDHAMPGSSLKIADIDLLPLDEGEDFSHAAMRRYLPAEADHSHLEVVYTDADFDAVMADYDAQLKGLGFAAELEQTHPNRTVLHYTHGETTARVVFTRHGKDVSVFMRTL